MESEIIKSNMQIGIVNDGELLTMKVYKLAKAEPEFGVICIPMNSCFLGSNKYEELDELGGKDKRKFFNGLEKISPPEVVGQFLIDQKIELVKVKGIVIEEGGIIWNVDHSQQLEIVKSLRSPRTKKVRK